MDPALRFGFRPPEELPPLSKRDTSDDHEGGLSVARAPSAPSTAGESHHILPGATPEHDHQNDETAIHTAANIITSKCRRKTRAGTAPLQLFADEGTRQAFAKVSFNRMMHLFRYGTPAALEIKLVNIGEEALRNLRSADVGAWAHAKHVACAGSRNRPKERTTINGRNPLFRVQLSALVFVAFCSTHRWICTAAPPETPGPQSCSSGRYV